jgi:hypothetical protein
MSEPAKDEAELVKRIAIGVDWLSASTATHIALNSLAAIRAAGWAVVPKTELDILRRENALLLAALKYPKAAASGVKP